VKNKLKSPILFFDIGGTLIYGPDSSPAERLVKALHLEEDKRDAIRDVLFTTDADNSSVLTKVLRKKVPGLPSDVDKVIKDLWNLQKNEAAVFPKAVEAVRRASAHGFKLGIISNIWRPYYEIFKTLFAEVFDYFEIKILSFKVGVKKPDMRIYKMALKAAGNAPACMAGDRLNDDIAPARAAGLRTVLILTEPEREFRKLDKIKKEGGEFPDFIIPHVGALDDDRLKMLKAVL